MTDGTHSKLGASSMGRWAACPGSVKLCVGLPSVPNQYSTVGTVAHRCAEECLNTDHDMSSYFGAVYEQDGFKVTVDEKMARAVQLYLDVIRNDAAKDLSQAPFRYVEESFHMADLHPELYGTTDCVQIWPGKKLMRVYDYKNGTSYVPADSDQLKYYALGMLRAYGKPITYVELVIVQPNCSKGNPVRRHKTPVIELLEFQADLLDAVRATEKPGASLATGNHCYWCPAKETCPEQARARQDEARAEFSVEG